MFLEYAGLYDVVPFRIALDIAPFDNPQVAEAARRLLKVLI